MTGPSAQTTPMQFADAMRCLGRAKNILMTLLVLCLLVQLAVFICVAYFGLVDDAPQIIATGPAAAETADESADEEPTTSESDKVNYRIFKWALASTKFIALVAAGILMLTLMFAVKISLHGRLGATAGFLGAFFWSLILLAMLVPWQQIINSSLACGATFNLDQLIRQASNVHRQLGADPEKVTAFGLALYYGRFAAYPVVALLVSLVVCLKFAAGYRPLKSPASTAPQGRPPLSAGAASSDESSPIQM